MSYRRRGYARADGTRVRPAVVRKRTWFDMSDAPDVKLFASTIRLRRAERAEARESRKKREVG